MLDTITASFGIALFEVGDNLETLLTRADDALYQAKRSGRNQVHR
jgi:diguanylate cyclase